MGVYTQSTTHYTAGEFTQTVGRKSIGIPSFLWVDVANDLWGDGGERYRTSHIRINAGIFSVGLNMFTGEPDQDNPDGVKNINGNNTYVATENSNPDKYRFSALYLGIGSMRMGINSDKVRGFFQNDTVHNITKDPYFSVLNRQPRFYWYFGTGLGCTLW